MTNLAIIIVSYNTCELLDECVRSLNQPGPTVPTNIVVVDNGSTDGSVRTIRRRWPHVKVIDIGRNIGYAAANNIGIRETNGELILLLNSDTLASGSAIDTLVKELRSRPNVGAIGPRLVNRYGQPELSFGNMIGPFNELIQKGKRIALTHDVPVISRRIRASLIQPGYHDWVSGACLLFWRRDAEAAGGLDERFFLYGEDVDFCAALRRIGKRVFFTPNVEVLHHIGQSGLHVSAQTALAYRRSQLAFYSKHHPAWAPLLKLYLTARGKFSTQLS